jgi:purine catabolism regulator
VTELILDRVVARQQAWLRRSEKVHELFTRIVLSGGDLPQLARFLELQIGRPVRIVDRWGDVSEAGPDSQAAANPGDWGSRAARIPVTAEHKDLGSILVLTGDGGLQALDAMVAAHAATAAALILLMERATAEGEARGQSELLIAMLNGSAGSPRELERRAVALGFDPRSPCAVVHLSVLQASTNRDPSELADIARWAVDRALGARRTTALQAWDGSDVTLMLPDPLARSQARVKGLLDEITAFVHRQDPALAVSCGIGSVSPTLGEVRESFREAVSACRLGTALRGPGAVTAYDALGPYPALYEALQADGSSTALDSLQQRYLGAVSRYEEDSGLPLLETLTVYFNERGNQSATARALGINRQSLLYRLERFEAIAGVELASPVDRFGLELALLCWRLKNGSLGTSFRDAVVA